MKYIVCTTIILLFILIPIGYSLPDLQVWRLEYSKETGRLVANIYNQAPEPAEGGFVVNFYDNDMFIGQYFYNKTLPRYSIVAVYVKPDLKEGQHNFKAIVDADNKIAERQEGNNEETLAIEHKIDKTPTTAYPTTPISLIITEEENIITYIIIAIIVIVIVIIILKFISSWHKKRKMKKKLTLSSPPSSTTQSSLSLLLLQKL